MSPVPPARSDAQSLHTLPETTHTQTNPLLKLMQVILLQYTWDQSLTSYLARHLVLFEWLDDKNWCKLTCLPFPVLWHSPFLWAGAGQWSTDIKKTLHYEKQFTDASILWVSVWVLIVILLWMESTHLSHRLQWEAFLLMFCMSRETRYSRLPRYNRPWSGSTCKNP